MGIVNAIYENSPIPLQSCMLSLYGVYLDRLRYGKTFREALAEVKLLDRLSRPEIERWQSETLRSVIDGALKRSPYYANKYSHLRDSLPQINSHNLGKFFPLLTKECVRSEMELFYARESGVRYSCINTSGSTGSPLAVLTTQKSVSKNYAFFESFLNAHGVSYRDKSATFAGRMIIPPQQSGPPYWRRNFAQNTWLMSSYHLSDETCSEYVRFLGSLRPVFIDSYPSAVTTLARFINRNKIAHEIRPKVIVTSSESLTDVARQEIEQAFQCKVADQYGNAEMAGFIAQCEYGSYHANPFYGLMEVVDPDGNPVPPGTVGNLALTGFVNPSMPLIRYLIGDSVVLSETGCQCGRAFPIVKEIMGRTDDLIVLADGRRIGRMDPLFKGLDGLSEAQIIQRELDEFEVRVVYASESVNRQEIAQKLSSAIRSRLNADVNIVVTQVSNIEKGANGKFKSVVSLVKQ